MAAMGRVVKFSLREEEEEVASYVLRLKHYFKANQIKEGEYIIVEFSPDIENMLGMNVGNKNEQQHTENEESQKESTSVSKAMRESSGEQLWATNHATATDLEATTAFIKIVGSDRFQLLLNDRKTRKSQVWQQVYQQMIKLGYRVSESLKDGGIKCAQKWRNLERSYIQYVGQIKTAGVNKRKKNRKPPLHYEELHAILKGKNFTDYDETMMPSGTTNEYEQRTYNSDIDMPEDLPTSFSSSRNIKTSEATPQDVLDFVVNEAKKQEKQFAKLCEILNRQNDEKKRLTDAIIAYLGQPLEPRKRKASDTDSD